LSFKESTELAALPDRIDALEREREKTYLSLSDPVLLRDGLAVARTQTRIAQLDAEIGMLTQRWEALETQASS
ncbi:MAG: ABC transporter C-terminal domain-containing protein, partial [bacterium]